ncbi:MAG: DUF3473 domain-containing protein [Desulfosoma sp.]|uniref:DUF3473 domain-containing protein n=1 Tax=Desulfosoma sp. TaxID=2603217 RepID=UPI00404A4D59
MSPSILLTFDVEDWFQVENLRAHCPESTWEGRPLRVERSTLRLLDLLDEASGNGGAVPHATFFVLGWVARRCPGLVRRIHERGHEVASHGYGHRLCRLENREALASDLKASKALLEDILGCPVHGYRAPGFSIDDNILHLIRHAGYAYDSSYNSFRWNPRYGRVRLQGATRCGIGMRLDNGLVELPLSNLDVRVTCLPWAGGGYFRFLPPSCFHWGVRSLLQRDSAYLFYLHPWELDPGQPRLSNASRLSLFRHYHNLNQTEARLRAFLKTFSHCDFLTCWEYLTSAERLTGRVRA